LSAAGTTLRELVDPPGLVVAGSAGLASWLLHAPGPVAITCSLAVLAVKIGAGLLLRRAPTPEVKASPDRGPLTRREWEICLHVAEGLTNREIASRLFITEAAVDSHLAHVREKLGFHSRAEISRWVTERRR
jgi:DNA-binding CsgD family transcriptional regulator